MFEAHVLYLLKKYLGEYVEGLSIDALRISVWKGDVVLKDLKLKAEALNSLKLPVIVKAGFVGSITLKVPWKSPGKEPVIVLIDRVFVLAQPVTDEHSLKEEDSERLFEAKLRLVEEAESAILEAASRPKGGTPHVGNSWLGSFIATIIGNLKVSISNVHFRYEDSVSNPGHSFCAGITLSKLAAVTTDEQGNETFDTSGALDKLRKSLQLHRLALYHDTDTGPWNPVKRWEDLSPVEWTEIFGDGIDELVAGGVPSVWAINRTYLVSPINGVLNYHRLGKQERIDPDVPFEMASLVLSDVSLNISEPQYYDALKLLETYSIYKTRVDISHLRPVKQVMEDPHSWWKYASLACLQKKKLCYWFSWERIKHFCQLRRHYVQLYASSLQQLSIVNNSELRQIEKNLDSKIVILWRLLAHAKVESVRSKEASKQKGSLKRNWWSFGWRTSSVDASLVSDSMGPQLVGEEKLTKEEWETINKMLSYQSDEELNVLSGNNVKNMIRYLVDVSIGQAAARIININQMEIACGRFEQLHLSTKLYRKSTHCDVSLKYYGLSSPEGPLAESVSSEKKNNALVASFIHAPDGEDVDWRLSATIAPCHVTVLMISYERFIEFVRRSNAVSPAVALETANALQNKIEKVTRRAQEQIQMVLEEESRFELDVDFDAPKVLVPMVSSESSGNHFLLDFGHFTLHTRECQGDSQRHNLYSRFYISGRDMAAFFIDGFKHAEKIFPYPVSSEGSSLFSISETDNHLYSLVDRCGLSVILDQIKLPHPVHPSMRISVQVPNISFHFSPARYHRIMELMSMFSDTAESINPAASKPSEYGHIPWLPADLAASARILTWRGIGNSLAEWQPCFVVLSGLYLYVLESEASQSYQKCSSMAGRQVFEIAPTNVGGSLHSLAVSSRGIDIQKALESSHTVIIEFHDDEEKTSWFKKLLQATYLASAPPEVGMLGDPSKNLVKSGFLHLNNVGKVDLVINGVLVELKVSLYGKIDNQFNNEEEGSILVLLAGGGKITLLRLGVDLTIKMKLHSLKIKDEHQGHLSAFQRYLACSMLTDSTTSVGFSTSELSEKDSSRFFIEDDDSFIDALSDFMSTPDQASNLYDINMANAIDQINVGACYDLLSHDEDLVKGKIGEVFYEAWDNTIHDFVTVTFISRSSDSPFYDGIDTQMSVQMSALEFFCNRPTIVALIDFGLDLSLVNSELDGGNDMHVLESFSNQSVSKEGSGRNLVAGLLGYGKSRVVFKLAMDVDSVCIYLNKEDGSQLAKFVQESFLLDLKVHPSSLTIEGTLGNMRLCDMSLGPDHKWGWLCDIRNQGTESLIKFNFQSYSINDDDYEGYDYSLHGRLSAVRIIFLYRFVQEITSYFMELASPHSEEAIKLVDKVGGFEWLIQKYEIDGASAIKFDLSLDTPIIIVPKNSESNDYMQLDLGQLQVQNSFSWHGCKDEDPSAVHLDVLNADIHGVNLAVGVNGITGNPMIRKGDGIRLQVSRSLRDVFRKVPTLSVDVEVGFLQCVMLDKEYRVILDCAYTNFSEEPKLPPSFRGNPSQVKDSIRMLADKVNHNSQILLLHTVAVFGVKIQYALLELYNTRDEESSLAQIALEGLWVSYRTTSLFEADLYVTIPKFSVLDIRPDTKPEMRLMLGSFSDDYPTNNSQTIKFGTSEDYASTICSDETYNSNLTMLILDYRWRSSFQSAVIRIQQPRLLVVLDFILPVVEFFVPSLGSLTGREETLDPKNDPLTTSNDIVLSDSIYMQTDDVVCLSHRRLLIVDGCGVDEFIYDGCGKTLSLMQFDAKGELSSGSIIIIGRGKKLRFKNVNIKNGTLLRQCVYLSSDSSFSVSREDGVEMIFSDNCTSDSVEHSFQDSQRGAKNVNNGSSVAVENEMNNFTFEAQVVSPELTFYDSCKQSFDGSLQIEKLLRAKMDFNFMYASNESDIWIQSLVKDLIIEGGSGLVVLEPVNISGGFTSLKDKTTIAIVCTDIRLHISLGVASLLLKLQSQVAEALRIGNEKALIICSNFQRLWVSQKGNLPGYNMSFWRPQAPSNYAILGDCVTSRPIPPSHAVMAVSNIYGRVRKPLGYNLIGSFSDFYGTEGNNYHSDEDCCIWMPIPPPGYVTVGCVVHTGSEPPPNHIVYCLRADLATSSSFSDCLFYCPSDQRLPSGFSIWRIDNIVSSFFAHASLDCPVKVNSFNLHQILLHNPSSHLPMSLNPSANFPWDDNHQVSQSQTESSSGWDILRSSSRFGCYASTPHFERIWWDKGSDLRKSISVWRPLPHQGFAIVGDCMMEGLEPPPMGLVFKCNNSAVSSRPVQFTKVAHISGKGGDDAYFWYPIPPPGYASLGCVVSRTDEVPLKDSCCCPRLDLVSQSNVSEEPISSKSSSRGSNCWSIWKVENQAFTFLARSDLKRPSSRLAFCISDNMKPKARENTSAELKLGCLSLTVVDSLCGTMTPVFDTTITNLNLATHGHLEAMNAVLICSIAASTFNRQLEAWEPLIEPFDGIFKLETDHTGENFPGKVGKRLRISSTSILNVNVTAANIETFTEFVVSWNRQIDLEQKALRRNEEVGEDHLQKCDLAFSALDEDDFQKVTVTNNLGCEVFLRKMEDVTESIELLQQNAETSFLIRPPRFTYTSNMVTRSREARYFAAIQIIKSKELPIVDDGNIPSFFCALRLLVDQKASKQYTLFPQSARTRCVRPSISRLNDRTEGSAKWCELFVFELPEKGFGTLEIEVTNLGCKAGKGEVIGALSLPIGNEPRKFKRAVSVRMLQAADSHQFSSYPLKKIGQSMTEANSEECGLLVLTATYFERKNDINFQNEVESTNSVGDIGFLIGLHHDGPWESFGSLLPLSIVPKTLDYNPFALEVLIKNGKKHAILRALAAVINNTDMKLEVSLFPSTLSSSLAIKTGTKNTTITEEIFENQSYHPISGWGNKIHISDFGHWSTIDFSYTSKIFFEPSLPSGWKWVSPWSIEKSPFVDSDGWTYGSDFHSIKWPPVSSKSSSKSNLDFVRRRRWLRVRQLSPVSYDGRASIAVVDPGSSASLPWGCMTKDTNLCVQLRPYDQSTQESYSWGQAFILESSQYQATAQQVPFSRQQTMKRPKFALLSSAIKLNQLEKNDTLMYCKPGVGCNHGMGFWFSVATDASILHTELKAPVYDWKISIGAVLKLENKLPSAADYSIWEKVAEGSMAERQHGMLSPGGVASVYLDLRKPIYLTLFLQGGWFLEKEAVLIMDLLSRDHVSSFWMVQKENKRRLHVSVERDMGETNAAPKTVRFFVPYWICNDSLVPLSYQIVEVEHVDNPETDSLIISRAVKSAKLALSHSSKSLERKISGLRKNIQVLDAIEDSNANCVMISPQDYISRSSVLSFPSRVDVSSTQIGVSVALRQSDHYSSGVSLYELENKERIDVKAFASDGSYYKLSVQLTMSSDRTKVIRFLPRSLFINRLGFSFLLRQCGTDCSQWFHPFDPPKIFKWQSNVKNELLKVWIDGYQWSTPFSIENDGVMTVCMKNDNKSSQKYLIVEVRSGTKSSCYEVIFSLASSSCPYRIENRSMFLPIRFRQVDGNDDSWHYVLPNSSASFLWEDLGRQRLLEILVDGMDLSKSMKYKIDEVMDHQPMQTSGRPSKAVRLTVIREGKILVSRISDWMPDNGTLSSPYGRVLSPVLQASESDYSQLPTTMNNEFHVILEIPELGLSVVDHMPEEILYLSVKNLLVLYASGLGSGLNRFKLRMQGVQIDNQLPFTPMPVLFCPQRQEDQKEYMLKFSVTIQTNDSLDSCVYPYLGLQVPDNYAFLVNIHEPIIWRLHEMLQQVKLTRISTSPSKDVSVDPVIQIGLFNISEIRFKVSMAMSPTQRPKGVLGFWSSLMTALGNTEHMPVRINQRFHEDICMRQSSLLNTALSNIQKDLLSQPLQLLSGVDILGNASSALGHMSKGVAALSMDKKFIQSRQRQDSKGVEDFGDVIREGGGAFAKGLFRGVTGIVTKPFEGAKSSGVEGFVQGVGKGLIGAAAQPVSGVLDLLSKTTEGANAVRMKIASAIMSEEQLLRRRLPRVISGDNLLQPYDEFKATGQVILQLAESGTFLGQVDLFKVRGKFALSDAYEDHFPLPKGKILVVTHRRALLLQQPTNIMSQRRFNPARDPCSVLWDVTWNDLVTMELVHGKKDHTGLPPSQLILYLQIKPNESKESARIIKCTHDSQQANEIFASIECALKKYGPNASKDTKKMTKPYAPLISSGFPEASSKESFGNWGIQDVPRTMPANSVFGAVLPESQVGWQK